MLQCVNDVSACVVVYVCVCVCVCVSEVKSSQQPAEEASPLGPEEADEEVDHSGDEDDACCEVVQVVESFLIGHHVQVSAGYNTHTHTHKTDTHTLICMHAHIDTHAHTWCSLIFTHLLLLKSCHVEMFLFFSLKVFSLLFNVIFESMFLNLNLSRSEKVSVTCR